MPDVIGWRTVSQSLNDRKPTKTFLTNIGKDIRNLFDDKDRKDIFDDDPNIGADISKLFGNEEEK
jgi:hypothetical protein